jgi:hypothetical protein
LKLITVPAGITPLAETEVFSAATTSQSATPDIPELSVSSVMQPQFAPLTLLSEEVAVTVSSPEEGSETSDDPVNLEADMLAGKTENAVMDLPEGDPVITLNTLSETGAVPGIISGEALGLAPSSLAAAGTRTTLPLPTTASLSNVNLDASSGSQSPILAEPSSVDYGHKYNPIPPRRAVSQIDASRLERFYSRLERKDRGYPYRWHSGTTHLNRRDEGEVDLARASSHENRGTINGARRMLRRWGSRDRGIPRRWLIK